jgi:hypothetical protein
LREQSCSLPFGNRKLKELLLNNCKYSFEEQKDFILEAFEKYKGAKETQDDLPSSVLVFNNPTKIVRICQLAFIYKLALIHFCQICITQISEFGEAFKPTIKK